MLILILKASGLKIVLFGTKADFSPKNRYSCVFKDLFSFSFFMVRRVTCSSLKIPHIFFISNSLLVFFAIFLKNQGIIDLENSDLPSPYTK